MQLRSVGNSNRYFFTLLLFPKPLEPHEMCDSRSRQCDLDKRPSRDHKRSHNIRVRPSSNELFSLSGTLPTPTSSDTLSETAVPSPVCSIYPIGACATSVQTSALPSAVAECTNNFYVQLCGVNMTSTSGPYVQVCSYIGVTFVLRIQWLSGCTLVASQNPQNPVPNNLDISDVPISQNAFSKCEIFQAHVRNVCS